MGYDKDDLIKTANQLSGIAEQHSGSLEQLTQGLLAAIRKRLGTEVSFVSEMVGDWRLFRYVDADPDMQLVQPGGGSPREESYCQRVIDGRLPQLIHNARDVPAARDLAATEQIPVGAHLSVPIRMSDGTVFGTFCTFSRKQDPSLNEVDLAVVRMFADVVAALIEQNPDGMASTREAQERVEQRLAAGEPHTVFQPIVDLSNLRIRGFEVLARFPLEPLQTPDVVFREAGRAGLSRQFTRRTIEGAITVLERLPATGLLSINLEPDLVVDGNLQGLLSGINLERTVLEITEHAAVKDYGAIAEAMAPLRRAGARLAIDDAGAGYASFRHILRLDPDIIKLDMSLIRDIDRSRAQQALAAGLAEFARRGGYELVAEGIETEAELQTLQSFGTAMGQGYLFARPMEIDTLFCRVPNAPYPTVQNLRA